MIQWKNQHNPPHPVHLDLSPAGLVESAIIKHPALCSRDLHLPDPFMVKLMVGKVCAVCAGAAIPHLVSWSHLVLWSFSQMWNELCFERDEVS